MNLIKNAAIYKVELPEAKLLAGHLQQLEFVPITPAEMSKAGFVINEATNEMVTPIEGGLSFTLRYDEKVIPASAVNAKLKARVAELEQLQLRKIGRKEKQDLKETVLAGMAAIAFVKSTLVHAFYQQSTGYLIVATASNTMAERLVSNLIKAVGSLKTETIHINELTNGLTAKLHDQVASGNLESSFGSFYLGSSVSLKGPAGEKVSFKLDDLENVSEGISEVITQGMKVEKLQLVTDACTFKLSSDFRLSGITMPDAEDPGRDELEHAADIWRHDAAVSMLIVCDVAQRLCDLFGYKQPSE